MSFQVAKPVEVLTRHSGRVEYRRNIANFNIRLKLASSEKLMSLDANARHWLLIAKNRCLTAIHLALLPYTY